MQALLVGGPAARAGMTGPSEFSQSAPKGSIIPQSDAGQFPRKHKTRTRIQARPRLRCVQLELMGVPQALADLIGPPTFAS